MAVSELIYRREFLPNNMAEKIKNYKTSVNEIKKFLGKFVLFTAKHLFLDCLFIILLVLLLFGFFYHECDILAQKAGTKPFEPSFLLEKTDYQKVMDIWQENEKRFKDADSKEYINPFEEPTVAPEEAPESGS